MPQDIGIIHNNYLHVLWIEQSAVNICPHPDRETSPLHVSSVVWNRERECCWHLNMIMTDCRYLKEFRVEQCPSFLQHKCTQHKPFTCFNWHFMNQRRRRPVRKRDGTFNYSPDVYCTKYDEATGICTDGDEWVYVPFILLSFHFHLSSSPWVLWLLNFSCFLSIQQHETHHSFPLFSILSCSLSWFLLFSFSQSFLRSSSASSLMFFILYALNLTVHREDTEAAE